MSLKTHGTRQASTLTQVDGLVAAMHSLEVLLLPGCTHGLCWPCLGCEVFAEEAQDGKLHDTRLACACGS